MTTWSKRINNCRPTVESVLNQTHKPDLFVINLDYDNFPNGYNDIPEWLKELDKSNDNLEINFQEHDIHVWEKIIPTIRKYTDDYILLTHDCDVNYPETYIEEIIENMKDNDWLCSQHDDITQGQYMVYGPKAVRLIREKVTDDLITEIDLDDHLLGNLLFVNKLKRGKKIKAKCVDRQEGYSFRRFFVDGYDESELKDTTCDYPHRQFIKELNIMRSKGVL